MAGRIETYIHSDNSTKNKAGAMVRLTCQTDFGARTEAFGEFARQVAKYACAFQIDNPVTLFAIASEAGLQEKLEALEALIGETIFVSEIKVMTIYAEESVAEKRLAPVGKYAELAKKKKEAIT